LIHAYNNIDQHSQFKRFRSGISWRRREIIIRQMYKDFLIKIYL
jgi:hypothetical protein